MKKIFFAFILAATTVVVFCQESTLKEKIVNFENATTTTYKEFYKHLGDLYLFYKEIPRKYQRYNENNGKFVEQYNVIEEVEYYYKKKNNFCYIGKINLDGVFDKNNKCIVPFPKTPKDTKVAGYDSKILEIPFNNSVVLIENGSARDVGSYGWFRMNYITNTFETFNPFNDED